eukprot:767392-Hanusia_phi.AAC.2
MKRSEDQSVKTYFSAVLGTKSEKSSMSTVPKSISACGVRLSSFGFAAFISWPRDLLLGQPGAGGGRKDWREQQEARCGNHAGEEEEEEQQQQQQQQEQEQEQQEEEKQEQEQEEEE